MSTQAIAPASVPQAAWYECALEKGWIPDALIRAGIRRLCAQRLRKEQEGGVARKMTLIEEMRRRPIGLAPYFETGG